MIPRRSLPLIALVALLSSACAATFSAGVAVVNGVAISKADLAQAVKDLARGGQQPGQSTTIESERQALSQLIAFELIRQEARRRKISPTDAAVQQQLTEIKSSFQSNEQYQAALAQAGLTEVSLTRQIRDSLLREAVVRAIGEPVTNQQISEVYRAQLDNYRLVDTKHILIAVDQDTSDAQARTLADSVLTRLRGGESFAALAKRFSSDPGSKDNGGALGPLSLAGLDPAYGQAAWKAKIGALTGPVRSQFGWHIIVTTSKRTQPLSEVSGQLREQLEGQLAQRTLTDFLGRQRQVANVEVNPRYGDWDPSTGAVVPHQGFVPASPPALDDDFRAPGGIEIPQQ